MHLNQLVHPKKLLNIMMLAFFLFAETCLLVAQESTNSLDELSRQIQLLQQQQFQRGKEMVDLRDFIVIEVLQKMIELEQKLVHREQKQHIHEELLQKIKQLEDNNQKLAQQLLSLQKSSALTQQTQAIGSPTPTQSPLVLGLLALQAEQPDLALKHLQPYLQQNSEAFPKDLITISLARSYYQAKEYTKALQYYALLLKSKSQSSLIPHALYEMGTLFGEMGDSQKQEVFYGELMQKYPNHRFSQELQTSP